MELAEVSYAPACEHAPESLARPSGNVCEDCGATFNLRLCAHCGYVGCCESQAGHDRIHAFSKQHPVILSMPAGRGFTWCYAENRYV